MDATLAGVEAGPVVLAGGGGGAVEGAVTGGAGGAVVGAAKGVPPPPPPDPPPPLPPSVLKNISRLLCNSGGVELATVLTGGGGASLGVSRTPPLGAWPVEALEGAWLVGA